MDMPRDWQSANDARARSLLHWRSPVEKKRRVLQLHRTKSYCHAITPSGSASMAVRGGGVHVLPSAESFMYSI
jgi:hypothetical protein